MLYTNVVYNLMSLIWRLDHLPALLCHLSYRVRRHGPEFRAYSRWLRRISANNFSHVIAGAPPRGSSVCRAVCIMYVLLNCRIRIGSSLMPVYETPSFICAKISLRRRRLLDFRLPVPRSTKFLIFISRSSSAPN